MKPFIYLLSISVASISEMISKFLENIKISAFTIMKNKFIYCSWSILYGNFCKTQQFYNFDRPSPCVIEFTIV